MFLEPHNTLVLDLLKFILTHNYFLFNRLFYHQLRGAVIGSPCAPSYTNMLLGGWENQIVFAEQYTEYN